MEISLRAKYRSGFKSRFKSPAGTGAKKRNKKKNKNAPPQHKRMMWLLANGKKVMRHASDCPVCMP